MPDFRTPTTAAPARRTRDYRRALATVLFGALVVGLVAWVRPAEGLGYSPLVDAPAAYQGQTTCARSPQPGTVALSRWLLKSYPGTGSMGLMRACGTGGRSEHKDGRAFDWAADVRNKRAKRAAYRFIRAALAGDAGGNAHALARRMGIMYLIYNDTIWSSSHDFAPRPYLNAGCRSLKKCSRTLRHLNHVHISLGWAGAAAQTSWYRARGVPALPVLHPGTNELDADATAVVGLTVPATGATVRSSYLLRAGVTYRVVAAGTVGYGAGVTGDASCTWSAAAPVPVPTLRGTLVDPGPTDPTAGWDGWQDHEGSSHPASPAALPLPASQGLAVNGALRWDATGCRYDHTYEAWFTPLVDQWLEARTLDPVPAGGTAEGTGSFRLYVARDDIALGSLAG
ncbi:hypothetical protein [Marmoricola sp. RAF53]|uniref:hypothetical protein n=1 Tax=Marmoricola sp. RAF53 TaxID=3233059 RepID=UPI003F99BBE2